MQTLFPPILLSLSFSGLTRESTFILRLNNWRDPRIKSEDDKTEGVQHSDDNNVLKGVKYNQQ